VDLMGVVLDKVVYFSHFLMHIQKENEFLFSIKFGRASTISEILEETLWNLEEMFVGKTGSETTKLWSSWTYL
jgi:hypothetical protein